MSEVEERFAMVHMMSSIGKVSANEKALHCTEAAKADKDEQYQKINWPDLETVAASSYEREKEVSDLINMGTVTEIYACDQSLENLSEQKRRQLTAGHSRSSGTKNEIFFGIFYDPTKSSSSMASTADGTSIRKENESHYSTIVETSPEKDIVPVVAEKNESAKRRTSTVYHLASGRKLSALQISIPSYREFPISINTELGDQPAETQAIEDKPDLAEQSRTDVLISGREHVSEPELRHENFSPTNAHLRKSKSDEVEDLPDPNLSLTHRRRRSISEGEGVLHFLKDKLHPNNPDQKKVLKSLFQKNNLEGKRAYSYSSLTADARQSIFSMRGKEAFSFETDSETTGSDSQCSGDERFHEDDDEYYIDENFKPLEHRAAGLSVLEENFFDKNRRSALLPDDMYSLMTARTYLEPQSIGKRLAGFRLAKSVENLLQFQREKSDKSDWSRSNSTYEHYDEDGVPFKSTIRRRALTDLEEQQARFLSKHQQRSRGQRARHDGSNRSAAASFEILTDIDLQDGLDNARPAVNILEHSAQKVASIISMNIDEHGNLIRDVEIVKQVDKSLGFFIRRGNGFEREDGIFISRVTLGSLVDQHSLLRTGDEITEINGESVISSSLEDVASKIQSCENLVLRTKSLLPSRSSSESLSQPTLRSEDDGMVPPSKHKLLGASVSTTLLHALRQNQESPPDDEKLSSKERFRFARSGLTTSINNLTSLVRQKSTSDLSEDALAFNGSSDDNVPHSFPIKTNVELEEGSVGPRQASIESLPSSRAGGRSVELLRPQKKVEEEPIHSPNDRKGFLERWMSGERASDNKYEPYPSGEAVQENGQNVSGSLVIWLNKIVGLGDQQLKYFCSCLIDGEFKARTSTRRSKKGNLKLNESFEVDLRGSTVLEFDLFEVISNPPKLINRCFINLHKVMSTKKEASLLLQTPTSIDMYLKLEFTELTTFLKRAPSTRKRGVFGFHLTQTLAQEENTIPLLVRKCVDEIERRGLDLEGIYRISGSARRKNLLRAQFEENSAAVDVSEENGVDCHVLAGILKDYLRELPQPLIPKEVVASLVRATSDTESGGDLVSELLCSLPQTNRITLTFIVDHLQKVARHSEVNKMSLANLAVVFGPVLMCPPMTSMTSVDMLDFKQLVKALEHLFAVWSRSNSKEVTGI